MHSPPTSRRVFGAALLVLLAVVLPLGNALSTQAATATIRQSGADRYATAVKISQAAFDPDVDVIFIATGRNFPDALAAGPAAAAGGGPLLLVEQGRIPSVVDAELKRLRPGRIVIVGGPAVVSDGVLRTLRSYTNGSVRRLAGADRYATAAAISAATFAPRVPFAYVATGRNFPDALAAAAVAGRDGAPVLLVPGNQIPTSVRSELSRLRPARIYVAGGPAAVDAATLNALRAYTGGSVIRVSGVDRYATAAAISARHFTGASTAYLATGRNFPDALTASPAAALVGAPLLLTDRYALSPAARSELLRLAPTRVVIVGGTGVISSGVATAVESLSGPARPTLTPKPTPAPTVRPTPSPSTSATPKPSPSLTPTSSPTPRPTPGSSDNVSGITIPAPLPGYTRHHFTEFPNETALGDGLHPNTLRYLVPRPDVARDCTYTDSSGRGTYCTRRTARESGGVLGQWLHTENAGQTGIYHVPNGNINYVGGLKWNVPNQREFVVSFVARFDDIPGRKVAFLRWCGPRIGTAGYCEDNFPEAKLEPGPRGYAFHHHESRSTQQSAPLNVELDQWHLYQMHVKPGQFVDFYLDGRRILHATEYVSSDPSYYVFQSETYLGGQTIPFPHNAGWLEFDSYALDLPN